MTLTVHESGGDSAWSGGGFFLHPCQTDTGASLLLLPFPCSSAVVCVQFIPGWELHQCKSAGSCLMSQLGEVGCHLCPQPWYSFSLLSLSIGMGRGKAMKALKTGSIASMDWICLWIICRVTAVAPESC